MLMFCNSEAFNHDKCPLFRLLPELRDRIYGSLLGQSPVRARHDIEWKKRLPATRLT
jgi:hypothetical protein